MYDLRPETDADWWEVEALLDTCFAPGRTLLSSYRLRNGVPMVPALSLVAVDGEGIIGGSIRYWPVLIGKAGHRALLLGPVAVHPTRQGEGLGAALINESLGRATAAGWERAILVGDAPYYNRFGFLRIDDVIMPPPTNPARVLGTELVPGAFTSIRGAVRRWIG